MRGGKKIMLIISTDFFVKKKTELNKNLHLAMIHEEEKCLNKYMKTIWTDRGVGFQKK